MSAPVALNELPAPTTGQSGWPWTAAPPASAAETTGRETAWPRITVVTPSYNQGQYLEATLRSVLLQGYPNLEYLVMDGGSTDESVAILRRYETWLDGWVSAPDRGQSYAINQGFGRASGQILAWLNSDDIYEPGALARIGRAFVEQPEAVLIFGQAYHISRAGRRIGQAAARDYDRRWLLEQGNSIPQPSAFFSLPAWQAVGPLDETLHFAMDYDLWFRLGDHGPVRFLPEFLSDQRIYPEAKTSAGDHRHYREVRQVIERYGGQGLPVAFSDWLLETHLPKAWEAYRSGDIVTGQAELSYVLENVPAMRAVDRLSQEIARYAWAMSVGLAGQDTAGLAFAQQVCRHLPATVAQPARLRRRVLASLHQASAQRFYARGQPAAVLRRLGQTVYYEPRAARDRGLWSLAARSLLRPPLDASRPVNLDPARQRLLAWLETLRGARLAGQYGARSGADYVTFESSALAALVRAAWGAPIPDPRETASWSEYLLSQQNAPEIMPLPEASASAECPASPASLALSEWQRTALAVTALRSLGISDQVSVRSSAPFLETTSVIAWLNKLDWTNPRQSSRQVQWLAVGLAHEHARTHDGVYWRVLQDMGEWLSTRLNPETGPWTFDQPITHLEALSHACNLAPLLRLLGKPLPASDRLIATILDLQRFTGLFGAGEPDEAWADLAAVDVLARVSLSSDSRAAEVRLAMALALRAILRRQQPDGGFAPGAPATASELPATWLRTLTLAIISARWPELVLAPLASSFLRLPELGAGHAASTPAAQPAARP